MSTRAVFKSAHRRVNAHGQRAVPSIQPWHSRVRMAWPWRTSAVRAPQKACAMAKAWSQQAHGKAALGLGDKVCSTARVSPTAAYEAPGSCMRCSWGLPERAGRRDSIATSAAAGSGADASSEATSAAAAAAAAGKDTEGFRRFEEAAWADPERVDQYAARFGALTAQAAPALLAAVGAGPGVRLLDVACGPGYVADAAASLGCEAMGLDFSPAMVEQARATYPAVTFVQGDAERLDGIHDDSLDAVTINFGILHLAQPELALQQALRVLKPGGRLAFTVWCDPTTAAGAGGLKALYQAVQAHGNPHAVPLPPGPPIFRFADPAESIRCSEAAGFVDLHVSPVSLQLKVQDASTLVSAARQGTVRIGALLRGQTADALVAIEKAVAEGIAAYRQPDGSYIVPMPCLLTSATKPRFTGGL